MDSSAMIVAVKKAISSCASGYKSYSESYDVDGSPILTIEFQNGDAANLKFPLPQKGDKGDDGASVISASVRNKHLILTKDDGTEVDCGLLPTSDYDDSELRSAIGGKVDKVTGKSLVDDTEIARLSTVDNYDDTAVKQLISNVADGLMDSVGYSSDYKTIDIIAKNGDKKSVDVNPVISHARIVELSDVDDTNKGNGKALVYNEATGNHEYSATSGTDELVKMDSSSDAKHLGDLIDKVTVVNESGVLKVKKLDGQEASIEEINYLKGLTMNVMDLVNLFANGGVKIIDTPVATYADLLVYDKSELIEGISYLIYVLADETHDGAKTTYLIDKDSVNPSYFGFADNHRNFTTNPINLVTEITGKLGTGNIDTDALFALLSVDDTYKTETSTNNIFSTHGAKALYDELVQAIVLKANTSDLTTHTSDTGIHVSSTEKETWNKVADKVDKSQITTTIDENSTDEEFATAKAVYNATKEVYSTDEQIIGTYLGKPLYRKVISINEVITAPQATNDGTVGIITKKYSGLYDNKTITIRDWKSTFQWQVQPSDIRRGSIITIPWIAYDMRFSVDIILFDSRNETSDTSNFIIRFGNKSTDITPMIKVFDLIIEYTKTTD